MAGANFCKADLSGATLRDADLHRANLDNADLRGADLSGANLELAILVGAKVADASFTGCRVYGIAAWDLDLAEVRDQSDLRITKHKGVNITVGDLEVAQFIYLLSNNKSLRRVIDTVTYKVVLILGRFTPERKRVLDALREELKTHDRLPVVFDFEQPSSQSRDETVMTLAGMARFVIADITDARSVLQELRGIVPNRPSLPVQPILLKDQQEPGMFDFFKPFTLVRKTWYYINEDDLLASIKQVIASAEGNLPREHRSAVKPATAHP
jgi:hypothetical protein